MEIQKSQKEPGMNDATRTTILQYLADIEKIDRNKKISSFTVPESHYAAIKLGTKLKVEEDKTLAIRLFSNLLRKGGWFRELKSVSDENYPFLLAGLQDRLSALGSDKIGFLHEIELRFVIGVPDLKKVAKEKVSPLPRTDFLSAIDILQRTSQLAHFTGLLKKRDQLIALFTAPLLYHAEITLLATPYLGADTSGRHYFVPLEFRLYWLFMMAVLASGESGFEKLLKALRQKSLIKNKAEFEETLARIVA